MLDKGIKITQLNDLLNQKNNTNYTTQNLSKRLNKDDMKFNDAEEILEILGYEITVVERIETDENLSTNTQQNENLKQLDLFKGNSSLNSSISEIVKSAVETEIKNTIKIMVNKELETLLREVCMIEEKEDS